jgi:hypothetical protein
MKVGWLNRILSVYINSKYDISVENFIQTYRFQRAPFFSGGSFREILYYSYSCCGRNLGLNSQKEKVHITSLNFRESPLFLPKLQNRAKHLPQLLKPFILPPWSCYKQFWKRFCFFLFYLFWLNLWKIIVNHKKTIKYKI